MGLSSLAYDAVNGFSDIVTFVDARFDKSEIPSIPPPPTAPENEAKDKKDGHPEKYAHCNPGDRTFRNSDDRG